MKETEKQSVLLELKDYDLSLHSERGNVQVLNKVNLTLREQETVGLVGESGCGKSMTALSLMGLLSTKTIAERKGQLFWKTEDISNANLKRWRNLRGKQLAMIFQEPMTALNPVLTIYEQLDEVLKEHSLLGNQDRRAKILELLRQVGLRNVERKLEWYPHQFSGGMRQRVMITMALICEPVLLIADEPTTALDVTTQAQILRLIQDLQKERKMALLFISHDLDVVGFLADRVVIMYAGEVVEEIPVQHLETPAHPYTIALQDARPRPGSTNVGFEPIPGTLPPPGSILAGCRFRDRCSKANTKCESNPPWIDCSSQHRVRCWFPKI
jgi:oligopeptide/dipeptide ABC transporter ATP-binding protein